MDLRNLHPAPGSNKKRKRFGRGPGSGHGGQSGRGHKGQKARSGGKVQAWKEGGQMPLHLRLPKRGFRNIFKEEFQIINLFSLQGLPADQPVTPEVLREHGRIKSLTVPVKLLGQGKLESPVTVRVAACSKSAREKVEAAGGKVEVA